MKVLNKLHSKDGVLGLMYFILFKCVSQRAQHSLHGQLTELPPQALLRLRKCSCPAMLDQHEVKNEYKVGN